MKSYILIIAVLFFSACGNSGKEGSMHPEAQGGRAYGGTLRLNEIDGYISLYPYLVTDAASHNIISQIYEGLVRFDPKNIIRVLPCIAQSWEVDATGLVYTFKIKKGVLFQDDACFPEGKGREVVASDFKYSFELLCSANENSGLFKTTFEGVVKGADAYYNNSIKGKPADLDGVKILDDHTLQITLTSPASSFLYILAGTAGYVVPHEAIEKYGNKATVGTGPFYFSSASTSDKLLLLRNLSYHRSDSLGNQLPFLDTICYTFMPDKAGELDAFKKGDLHIIFGLPAASISEMVEANLEDFKTNNPKYFLERSSEFSTQYYQFNITRKPFDNVKVRQAFSYAIDRDKIIADVLHSEAFGPGICGLTAPSISGYDITEIKGYNFNPEKARKLLTEAGYPNGKNFPHVNIEINSGGGKNVDVVDEVKRQLKTVLNVDVDYVVVPFGQKLEDARYGRAEMFRAGWVADYPSPENFLRIMYGATVPDSAELPSYPNTIRYKNPLFDSLFIAGYTAKDQEAGYQNYMKAEQVMMQDAPIIVLWYGENLKMIHSFVRNFYFNPLDYRDFSEVYIKKTSADTH
jgi:peptide/nickel transport system substrate-binding protein